MAKKLVSGLALIFGTACLAQQSGTQAMADNAGHQAEIVTLGTAGGPPPHPGESQPATLLKVGAKSYLVDAGENAGQQLLRAGVPSERLDAIFLTHLHWDHTLGLDYLMATGWMKYRRQPVGIWGPPGTVSLVSRTAAAIEIGEDLFSAQANRAPAASLYQPHDSDVEEATVIYRDDVVTVTAVHNSHFSAVHGAPHSYGAEKGYSYRFDTPQGCVMFTGDTGPSERVTELARGCDTLVSEIVDPASMERALEMANPGGDHSRLMTHMTRQHLTPEEVGRLASRAGAKRVILSHLVYGAGFAPVKFGSQVAEFYDGEIFVAKDLDRFPVRGMGK